MSATIEDPDEILIEMYGVISPAKAIHVQYTQTESICLRHYQKSRSVK